MTSEGVWTRVGRWITSVLGRGSDTAPAPGTALEEMRQRSGAAIVLIDRALRSADEELDLADGQVEPSALRRFRAAVDETRRLSSEAFAERRAADDLADSPGSADEECVRHDRVLALAESITTSLGREDDELQRLRALSARVPALLDELAARADVIAAAVPAAERAVSALGEEYTEQALASISEAVPRAASLILASRDLIASGRHHLTKAGGRPAACSAARAAEHALARASDSLREVDGAAEKLAGADEEVRQALNSIHADLNDARRYRASDPATKAALARAAPVIEAANVARRRGGDLLDSLAALEEAERDLDEALAPHREVAERQRRDHIRLERRVRNAHAFLRSVDARIARAPGGAAASSVARLALATQLADEAGTLVARDPTRATDSLNRAMEIGRSVEGQVNHLDLTVPAWDQGIGPGPAYELDDLLSFSLTGLLGGALGGGDGSGSSDGFGSGGRF